MTDETAITTAASTLGRLGGQSTSEAKKAAARRNGRRGGRPSLYDLAAKRVERSPRLNRYADYIMADWPEGNEHWRWVITAPVSQIAGWAERGMREIAAAVAAGDSPE